MMKYLERIKVNNRRGFTTIELVIGIAIVGVLGAAIVMTISQVFQGSLFSNNHNTAMNNVRNAGEWMSRDAEMANASLSLYETINWWPLKLIWYDVNEDKYETTYTLDGTDLVRTFTRTDNIGNVLDNQMTTVATHITSVTVSFDTTNNVDILTITISSPKDDKAWAQTGDTQYLYTRVFEVHPRP